jgi:hypothetical protein
MKELAFLVISGVLGLVTFGIIAKKYGSSCTP